VVEAPFAAEAAGGFHHAPAGEGHGKNLPIGGVEVIGIGETGEAQAGCEGGEGEQDAAEERWPAKAEDGGAGKHDTLTVDGFSYRTAGSISRRDSA